MTQQDEHAKIRKNVWSSAWSAVASADNCKKQAVATNWADAALRAFDERFPAPDESTQYKRTKIGF